MEDRNRNEEFLELYNELDLAIRERYPVGKKSYSAINFYIAELRKQGSKGNRFAESLDSIREMRNSLVHTPKIRGEDLFLVSEEAYEELKRIYADLADPPKLISYAVPFEKLLKAELGDAPLSSLNNEMLRRGISHVPVLKEGEFYGVYSEAVLFSYLSSHPDRKLEDLSLFDVAELLGESGHPSERYAFVPRNYLLEEALEDFAESKKKHGKRLALLLITEHGKPSERLLAAVSLGGIAVHG